MSTRIEVEALRQDGKSYNQICAELGISKSCVYWHANEKNREYARSKRRENRAKFVVEQKALAGGKCCRCGYAKCLAALHFHHKDPSAKTRYYKRGGEGMGVTNLSRSKGQKYAKIEIEKCELLCANCHAEEHWG